MFFYDFKYSCYFALFCVCLFVCLLLGWDEGCMTMSLGEKANLHIAGFKGYGAQGFSAWGYPY